MKILPSYTLRQLTHPQKQRQQGPMVVHYTTPLKRQAGSLFFVDNGYRPKGSPPFS